MIYFGGICNTVGIFYSKIRMPSFKNCYFSSNLPPPCCCTVVEEDDDEDITVLDDDCFWLLTINSCSFTAGVAGQIATCGTARAAGAGACCCWGLAGCGGNSPDLAAFLIAVPDII